MKSVVVLILAYLIVDSICAAASERVTVPMNESAWAYTQGSKPKFQNFAFRDAMFLGEVGETEHNDVAYLSDVLIQDGILEMEFFDTDGDPGFVFRMQDDGEYEVVYIRQGMSGKKKFIQYAPVYNSELSWQLYTRHQGSGIINRGGWTHLKAVFVGPKLEVYVDHREVPSLVVENLRRGVSAGRIGIFGLLPTYVANFSYAELNPVDTSHRTTDVEYDAGDLKDWSNVLPGAKTHGGDFRKSELLIRGWQMSPAYLEGDVDVDRYPAEEALEQMSWSDVETDYDGVLAVDKYRAKEIAGVWQDNSHEVVWLRKTIDSDRTVTKRLEFDFSNKVIIYLNGQPLYAGNNTWNSKQGFLWGSIAWGARSVYLPLTAGENELLVALISESDGWGIMGRIEDGEGLTLR